MTSRFLGSSFQNNHIRLESESSVGSVFSIRILAVYFRITIFVLIIFVVLVLTTTCKCVCYPQLCSLELSVLGALLSAICV